jgi:uncharacterized membrane protein YsdA (DUF1294 family)
VLLTSILGLALVASVAVAILLAWDKRRAVRGGRRIPESTLHTLELLGGWPGSLVARRLLRHKTVKGRYRAMFALCAITHVVVAGLLLQRLG